MARIYGVPKQTSGFGISANVRVVGIPQLLAKLRLVGSVARLELGLMNAGAAQMMFRLAQAYCPVRTGNLRSGIKVGKLGSYSWQVSAASTDGGVGGKNNKEYAAFVENGWSGHPQGAFFMRRAWDETSVVARSDLQIIARKIQSL